MNSRPHSAADSSHNGSYTDVAVGSPPLFSSSPSTTPSRLGPFRRHSMPPQLTTRHVQPSPLALAHPSALQLPRPPHPHAHTPASSRTLLPPSVPMTSSSTEEETTEDDELRKIARTLNELALRANTTGRSASASALALPQPPPSGLSLSLRRKPASARHAVRSATSALSIVALPMHYRCINVTLPTHYRYIAVAARALSPSSCPTLAHRCAVALEIFLQAHAILPRRPVYLLSAGNMALKIKEPLQARSGPRSGYTAIAAQYTHLPPQWRAGTAPVTTRASPVRATSGRSDPGCASAAAGARIV